MSGCGTGVASVAMPAGVSWDTGKGVQLGFGGQQFGKGLGKGAFGAQQPGKGLGKGAFGKQVPGKGLGAFPGKGTKKPVWQPTPGGGLAKQYPPGKAGIPYAWYPGYGIVQ